MNISKCQPNRAQSWILNENNSVFLLKADSCRLDLNNWILGF